MSRRSDPVIPPCAGKWDLFDSTELGDHAQAAQLCATCPMTTECRSILEQSRYVSATGGRPSGTWAGTLVGGDREAQAARREAEEAQFTDEQALRAHAQYGAGERDPWTRLGERVYDRKRKRARRTKKAA